MYELADDDWEVHQGEKLAENEHEHGGGRHAQLLEADREGPASCQLYSLDEAQAWLLNYHSEKLIYDYIYAQNAEYNRKIGTR